MTVFGKPSILAKVARAVYERIRADPASVDECDVVVVSQVYPVGMYTVVVRNSPPS